MRANLLLTLMVTLSFCSFISSALAAEVFLSKANAPEIYLKSDHNELHLHGPIEPGDFEKFRAKATEATGPFTLVLDSPGGRLDEALKIIDHIVSPPNGVQIEGAYLPENAECYSACAFIYMHAGFGRATDLRMHYTASLGFHAPWLDGFSTNSKLIADSPRAIKELTKHGRLPLELLLEFLDKGPNELYLIDTPYRAARYGIVVGGFYDPKLYSRVVSWPEKGGFGLVAPTRSSAFWAMGAYKVNSLRSLFAYGLEFAPWLGFSSRPIPQSTAEIIEMESFESFEDVDEWVKRNPETSGTQRNDFKGTLNVEAGLNGFTIYRSSTVSNSVNGEYQDEEVDGKHRDEEVEFHLSSGVLRESGLLRGVAKVRFSTRGLFVCCGPNENESEWTQLNYLLAFPPGMKLKDIPEFLRTAIAENNPVPGIANDSDAAWCSDRADKIYAENRQDYVLMSGNGPNELIRKTEVQERWVNDRIENILLSGQIFQYCGERLAGMLEFLLTSGKVVSLSESDSALSVGSEFDLKAIQAALSSYEVRFSSAEEQESTNQFRGEEGTGIDAFVISKNGSELLEVFRRR